MLSTDLDGPGIARHLVVSLNTVRSHTKSIYTKLGVNSRRAAVTRALSLLRIARTRASAVSSGGTKNAKSRDTGCKLCGANGGRVRLEDPREGKASR